MDVQITSGAITQFLAPLHPDAFFRDFWERRYCLITRNDPGHYAGVLTMHDIDAVLHLYRSSEMNPAQGRVSVVKSSEHDAVRQPVPITEFGLLDVTALYEAYHRGYTLIIDMIHARWPSIAALCQDLEALLHFSVQANVYVTPRGAQGFAPHFDTHDVFVLQLGGSKAWRIYDAGDELPMADGHRRISAEALGAPAAEFVLEQGDLLYVPRGVVHEAMTTDDSSVHLTVGVHVWRWADLLRDAILVLADKDVRLRKSVPLGMLGRGDADARALDATLDELLAAVVGNVNSREVLSRIGPRLAQRREPVPDGHFESLDRLDALAPDTHVRRRSGMLCSVTVKDGRATVAFPGGSVTGPAHLERALQFVARADVFQVRELPGPEWAPLSANAQVVLAKRLIRAGLLGLCDLRGAGVAGI